MSSVSVCLWMMALGTEGPCLSPEERHYVLRPCELPALPSLGPVLEGLPLEGRRSLIPCPDCPGGSQPL